MSLLTTLSLASLPARAQERLPPRARLTLLDGHLRTVHDEARQGRLIGGTSMLVLGALGVGVALYHRSLPDEETTSVGEVFAVLGGVVGGIFLGSGLLILALPGDEEQLPRRWWDQVDAGGDEVLLVQQGEAVLEELADDGRFARYISAGVLGLFALSGLAGLTSDDGAGVGGGLVNTALWGGLVAWTLLSESTAEEELGKYRAATAQGEGAAHAETPSSAAPRWSLAPWIAPQGAGLGAGLVF